MKKLKKYLAVISFAFIALTVALPVFATGNIKNTENVVVSENELVPYNFVSTGGMVDFQGEAQKDVIVAGGDVKISGPVHGDVIVGGGNVKIDGNVDGNVRALGGTIDINGKIGKNITMAGGNVTLGKDSEVGWDVIIGGGNVLLKGKIGGDVNIWAGTLTLGGEIGGNAATHIGNKGELDILPNAKINGNLSYWSVSKLQIPENATIGGKVQYNSTLEQAMKTNKQKFLAVYVFGILISIFSALIIGLIIISLFKEQVLKVTKQMAEHPVSSFSWGFVYLIIMPIVSLLFLIFIITIPLTVLMMIFYGITLYLTNIFVAILLGSKILRLCTKSENKEVRQEGESEIKIEKSVLMKSMIVGVIVYVLITNIPIIGWIIRLLATIWAFGAIGRVVNKWVGVKVGAEKKV